MQTFVITFFIVLGVYLVGCLVLGFVKYFTKRKDKKNNKHSEDEDENDKD